MYRIARLAGNDSAQVNRIIDTFGKYGMTKNVTHPYNVNKFETHSLRCH
jgi:hypothetical protein